MRLCLCFFSLVFSLFFFGGERILPLFLSWAHDERGEGVELFLCFFYAFSCEILFSSVCAFFSSTQPKKKSREENSVFCFKEEKEEKEEKIHYPRRIEQRFLGLCLLLLDSFSLALKRRTQRAREKEREKRASFFLCCSFI